jgi:hypothetical protein
MLRQPHCLSQTAGRHGFSDVHFLMLQRTDHDRIVLIAHKVSEGHCLGPVVLMQPEQLNVTAVGEDFIEGELHVHSGSDRKSAT